MLTFTGCGKEDPELTNYQKEVQNFCTVLEEAGSELSQVDFSSNESVDTTLAYLKKIETAFSDFSSVQVPKTYSSAEGLADDAYQYMLKSVSLYQEAFDNHNYIAEKSDDAYKYYKKAMNRVSYIANILEGKPIELKDGDAFANSSSTDNKE